MNAPMPRPSGFLYSPMFPLGPDRTAWKALPIDGVRTATCDGQTVLRIAPDALSRTGVPGVPRGVASAAARASGAVARDPG